MYEELLKMNIQITPFEYTKLEELKKTYTEKQILDAYKNSNVKNVNYISKVLASNKKRCSPDWLNKEIVNQELDEETIKGFGEFQEFIKEFRNEY